MGSVLSDLDLLDSAEIRENKESLMPFTVSLTGCRSIPRCIVSPVTDGLSIRPGNCCFQEFAVEVESVQVSCIMHEYQSIVGESFQGAQ